MSIPNWQKLFGIFIYMLPWSDSLPFGQSLFLEFPFLSWLALPAFPLIIFQQLIPLGSLILFFILFFTIVRNSNISYFIRFNTLQALLLDIGLVLISYSFRVLLGPFGNTLMLRTLSSTVLVSVLAIVVFSITECIQGKEPDLPVISQAVRMQLG